MGDQAATYNIPIPLQNIGCQDLLSEASCSYSGWLRKKRTVSIFTWPQVYVVLHEGCLYYFKHERSKSPSGKFSLYGYNSVFRAGEILPKEATWVFKIVHSHKEFKTYYFSASSEQEMKTWMMKVKQEMLTANGKILMYGKKLQKVEKHEDESKFYQEVETNIYDDSAKFKVPPEYSKQYSVKPDTEESDDDLDDVDFEKIVNRPPLPLPGQASDSSDSDQSRAPLPPPRPVDGPAALPPKPSFKPPRVPDTESPSLEPRVHKTLKAQESRSRSPSPRFGHGQHVLDQLNSQFKQLESKRNDEKKHTTNKRRSGIRGSYEKTDGPGNKSPSIQPKHHHAFTMATPNTKCAGGSTGSDASDDVSGDEYWAAIHYEGRDKQKAHDIIQAIGEEGVYLVRPEGGNQGGKVLVVFADDTTKKYRIQQSQDHEYFLAKEGFRSHHLEELLSFYYDEELPTVHVKLTGPYKLHSKYKELNL